MLTKKEVKLRRKMKYSDYSMTESEVRDFMYKV